MSDKSNSKSNSKSGSRDPKNSATSDDELPNESPSRGPWVPVGAFWSQRGSNRSKTVSSKGTEGTGRGRRSNPKFNRQRERGQNQHGPKASVSTKGTEGTGRGRRSNTTFNRQRGKGQNHQNEEEHKEEESVNNIVEAKKVEDIEMAAEEVAREALEEAERLRGELEEERRRNTVTPTVVAVATHDSTEEPGIEEDEPEKTSCPRKCITVLTFIALASVVIYFAFRGTDDEPTQVPTTVSPSDLPSANPTDPPKTPSPTTTFRPSSFPTPSPSQSPSFGRRAAIDIILQETLEIANHDKAYRWITQIDTWGEPGLDPESANKDVWISRYVMAILYYETNGDDWEVNTNWLAPKSVCDWYRGEDQNFKICDDDQPHVITSLWAPKNKLTNEKSGTLPTELSLLSNLKEMNLESNNFLMGTIPEEYCYAFPKLERLDLSETMLQGTIPFCIGQLTSLTWLDFEVNQLTGSIPPSIGNLTNLEKLELGPNTLSKEVPTEIGMLTQLTWLDVEANRLTGSIPSEIGNLSSLEWLSLRSNGFVGTIPAGVQELPTENKWLDDVKFDRESALKYILGDLVSGQFHAQAFEWLANTDTWREPEIAPEAENKDVWANRYALAVFYFDTCTTVKCKNTTNGWLSPESVCTWQVIGPDGNWTTNLCSDNESNLVTRITLELNGLQGNIPSEIGLLRLLDHLDIGSSHENMLSGTLPAEMFGLTKLTWLDIETNAITGRIPDFSRLKELEVLRMGSNILTGTIPVLSKMTKLKELRFENNRLTGSIPILDTLQSLQHLNLGSNALTGSVPELVDLHQLSWVELGNNNLSGDLPDLKLNGTFSFCSLVNNPGLGDTSFAVGDNCSVV